jgi:hypothetical protein
MCLIGGGEARQDRHLNAADFTRNSLAHWQSWVKTAVERGEECDAGVPQTEISLRMLSADISTGCKDRFASLPPLDNVEMRVCRRADDHRVDVGAVDDVNRLALLRCTFYAARPRAKIRHSHTVALSSYSSACVDLIRPAAQNSDPHHISCPYINACSTCCSDQRVMRL